MSDGRNGSTGDGGDRDHVVSTRAGRTTGSPVPRNITVLRAGSVDGALGVTHAGHTYTTAPPLARRCGRPE